MQAPDVPGQFQQPPSTAAAWSWPWVTPGGGSTSQQKTVPAAHFADFRNWPEAGGPAPGTADGLCGARDSL